MNSGLTDIFETILASALQIPDFEVALSVIYHTACVWGISAGEGALKETLARAMEHERTPAGIEQVPSERYLEYTSLDQRINLLLSEIDRRAVASPSTAPGVPPSVPGFPVTPAQETTWAKELAAHSPEEVLEGFAELLVRLPALYDPTWLDEFSRRTGISLGDRTHADNMDLIEVVRVWGNFTYQGGSETGVRKPFPEPEKPPVVPPGEQELAAIREAGHALMYDRVLRGRVCDDLFSRSIPAGDRSLLLTEYAEVALDGRLWGKPTRSLRSLITTSAVLLGGHISAAIRSGQDPAAVPSPQRQQATVMLEGYMEEYGGGDAQELLRTLYHIAYKQINLYWDRVGIIASKLILDGKIRREEVSRIIDGLMN